MPNKPATLKQLQEIEAAAIEFCTQGKAGGEGYLWDSAEFNAAEERLENALDAVGVTGFAQRQLKETFKAIGYDYNRPVLNGVAAFAPSMLVNSAGYNSQRLFAVGELLDSAERQAREKTPAASAAALAAAAVALPSAKPVVLATYVNVHNAASAADKASLVSIVGRGVPIDADGTNVNHDGARREVARILEGYFATPFTTGENTGKTYAQLAAKALGLKDSETKLDIIDDKGTLDRRLLDRALRLYQTFHQTGADGRVGGVTARALLSEKDSNNYVYDGSFAEKAVFGKGGAYLCGKTLTCDLQKYEGDDARKKDARFAIEQVRELIEGLKDTPIFKESLVGNKLSAEERAALTTFSAAITKDKNLTEDEIKAFQIVFGLNGDGVIGRQTLATANQVAVRLAAHEVIDPSDIQAAVHTQTRNIRTNGKQH